MKKTLVLIASSEWAVFVHLEGKKFEAIREFEHPQSREKVAQLVSDRPGTTFSSFSSARSSLNEGQTVFETERQKFAHELVQFCKEQQQKHPFQELWVVAGPKFLGELRPLLQKTPSLHCPMREIHKEVPSHEPLSDKMHRVLEWAQGENLTKRTLQKMHH